MYAVIDRGKLTTVQVDTAVHVQLYSALKKSTRVPVPSIGTPVYTVYL